MNEIFDFLQNIITIFIVFVFFIHPFIIAYIIKTLMQIEMQDKIKNIVVKIVNKMFKILNAKKYISRHHSSFISLSTEEIEDMIKFHNKWQNGDRKPDYRMDLSWQVVRGVNFCIFADIKELKSPIISDTIFINCNFDNYIEFSITGDMRNVQFINCNLLHVCFTGALINCKFKDCNMNWSAFFGFGRSMVGNTFEDCHMYQAKFCYDKIISCDFIDCDFDKHINDIKILEDCYFYTRKR